MCVWNRFVEQFKWALSVRQSWTSAFSLFSPLAATMETLDEIPPAAAFHLEHFGLNKHFSSFSLSLCSLFGMLLHPGLVILVFPFNISVIDSSNFVKSTTLYSEEWLNEEVTLDWCQLLALLQMCVHRCSWHFSRPLCPWLMASPGRWAGNSFPAPAYSSKNP